MEDKKKIAIGLGIAAGAGVLIYVLTRPDEELPPPPPDKANLYGKVTDAETGSVLPDVLITLDGLSAYTGLNGNYTFLNLTPGSYSGSVAKEGYETYYF